MQYTHFSRNGEILPVEQATVSLDSIEYAYGYGVYETIRVTKGLIFFLDEHCDRLMESAQTIGLEHQVTPKSFKAAVRTLVDKTADGTYNLKVLLIGGRTAEDAVLYIECFSPYFPDRKMYKQGAACTVYHYERFLPHAKTLNMLPSYLAYRDARATGAYDALLINRNGCVTEGTRTNFFCVRGKTIISPKESDILLGVTRKNVLDVAEKEGFSIVEQDIPLNSVQSYDAAFLTSTSTKIVPIRTIGKDIAFGEPPQQLTDLMRAFDTFLVGYAATVQQ